MDCMDHLERTLTKEVQLQVAIGISDFGSKRRPGKGAGAGGPSKVGSLDPGLVAQIQAVRGSERGAFRRRESTGPGAPRGYFFRSLHRFTGSILTSCVSLPACPPRCQQGVDALTKSAAGVPRVAGRPV